MNRKFFSVAMLGLISVSTLFAAGCSSGDGNRPYNLTGQSRDQSMDANAEHQEWRQRMMYTDDKGHYHQDAALAHRQLRDVPA